MRSWRWGRAGGMGVGRLQGDEVGGAQGKGPPDQSPSTVFPAITLGRQDSRQSSKS